MAHLGHHTPLPTGIDISRKFDAKHSYLLFYCFLAI